MDDVKTLGKEVLRKGTIGLPTTTKGESRESRANDTKNRRPYLTGCHKILKSTLGVRVGVPLSVKEE